MPSAPRRSRFRPPSAQPEVIAMELRHFTDLSALSSAELRAMLDDARARKTRLKAGASERPLEGKVLAMIFEKPSTRTRVSFDVGMRQLGRSEEHTSELQSRENLVC